MRSPFIKSPTDVNYWGVDWTAELDTDENIVTSSWVIVTPTTLNVVDAYVVDGIAVVWLEAGDLGDRVTITNYITTDKQPVARHLSRQILFWIGEAA